jgi:cytoskeletal protein RodZ
VSATEPPPPPPGGGEQEWEPNWDPEPAAEPAGDPGQDPSAPDQPAAPRGHRAPVGVAQRAGRLLAPLVAVAVVVLVVVLLIVINANPSGRSASGAADTTSPASVTHSSPTTRTTPTTTAAAAAPTKTASSPTPHPSRTGHPRSTAAPTTAMAPVQVLNNSRRTGLAHEVADAVAARGWHVVVVGNLQGAVPVSTVYYSPGDRAAAQHLAREFTSVQRVEPNSDAGLHQVGVTLVLTADWAG